MGVVTRAGVVLGGVVALLLPSSGALADARDAGSIAGLTERLATARRSGAPLTKRCHSDAFIEAYQVLPTLEPAQRKPIEELLELPPELTHFVESDGDFPVRVSFADASLQDKADQVLAAVALSYAKQVQEWGFWPPIVEAGMAPFRVYLMDAGGAAGYTAPYLDNDATPHNDAFTYIVIDPKLEGMHLDATVAHEFNHACQLAMDAGELRSFMENTASYIEVPVIPSSIPLAAAMFPYFQSQPFRPLEYRLSVSSDGYEYGGALWPMFLTHHYGGGDPAWLRRVWEGSVQEGLTNEPDYFDALDAVLVEDGFADTTGVQDAARAFARYRFFVGDYADGYHLPSAQHWGGAEVWVTAQWTSKQLPALDRGPFEASTKPQPNGCNYVTMTPDFDTGYPIKFSFNGMTGVPWDVSVLEIAAGKEPVDVEIDVDDQGDGSVTIDASELHLLVLVICQSTDAAYDPDLSHWAGADYRYSITYDVPPPTISSVTPHELPLGAQQVELTIDGGGFVDGEGLKVVLAGEYMVLERVKYVSRHQLIVEASVDPAADLGSYDLIVTNPAGLMATTSIDIVAPLAGVPAEDGPSGCACDMSAARPPRGWPLALLVGLVSLLRRRRDGTPNAAPR